MTKKGEIMDNAETAATNIRAYITANPPLCFRDIFPFSLFWLKS